MIPYMIKHSAPALARIKVANLFSYPYLSEYQLQQELVEVNQILDQVHFVAQVLKHGQKRALVYVYEKKQLEKRLNQLEIKTFLENIGYQMNSVEVCLSHLKDRLMSNETFPHEIGFFLGYPYEDVVGFIEHEGKAYLYKGYWKVYSHLEETKELFELYSRYKEDYSLKYEQGQTFERLLLASHESR